MIKFNKFSWLSQLYLCIRAVVLNEASACCNNCGRQSLLLKVPGLLSGEYDLSRRIDAFESLFSILWKALLFRSMKNSHTLMLRPCFFFLIQPGVESNKNCIADEHYLPTFFHVRIHFDSITKMKVFHFLMLSLSVLV